MRVAFDHHIFAIQRYGGVSRYFVELASRLPKDVVSDISVVAPLHINQYLSQARAQRITRGRFFPFTFRGHIRFVSLVDKLMAPLAWSGLRPDIVHETFFSDQPVGHGRKRVLTVYDMIHELFTEEFADTGPMTAAKRAAVARADHVICISESTRQDLIRLFGVEPARTSVVHLAHSMTSEVAVVAETDASVRKPIILYVGHRSGYKNFRRFAQAYAGSALLKKEFEIVAFGGPPFSAQENVELEQLGIRDRVRYRSGTDDELVECYRTAAVFVYPSLYEGFGIPPLEAMSWGCPVACGTGGSLPEVVGDAGVYFDALSVEEMRSAMERIVTTPSLQAELRARGYSRIKNFSWDRCAAETASVYRSLLDRAT